MSGDIKAINAYARSIGTRARAIALNTGISGSEAREQILAEDRKARSKRVKGALPKVGGA